MPSPALTVQGTPVWQSGLLGSSQPIFPPGYTQVAGHLALLSTVVFDGGATIPTPSGWFLTPNQASLQRTFAKKLTGTDTLPPMTWAGGSKTQSICVVLAGDVAPDITTMFEVASARQANTTSGVPYGSLTVSSANDFIYSVGLRHKTAAADGETFGASTLGAGATSVANVPAGIHVAAVVNWLQQTTATTIALGGQSTSKNDTSDSSVGYLLAIKTQGVASAGFTAGPLVNSVTAIPVGAYNLGFTGSAAGTFYAVAVQAGVAAPTAAQIVAGQDSTGAAALAAVSKAVTGADTAVLGGALINPLHDVHCVFRTTLNSPVASLLGQYLNPTTGRQFTVVTGLPAPGIDSILNGAVPPAAAPDVIEADLLTIPSGYALSISSVGAPSYVGTAVNESFQARLYDYSAGTWSARITDYINSQPPQYQSNLGPYASALNAPLTPIDLTVGFVDPQGNPVTITAASGMPPGISISANRLVGAGSTQGIYNPVVQGANAAGDFTIGSFVYIVGNVTVPAPLKGLLQAAAQLALTSAFLSATFVLVPAAGPNGVVLDSTPAEGTQAAPFSTVVVSISTPLPGQPPDGGGSTGGGGGPVTPPPVTPTPPIPPIQSPGTIVSRSANAGVQLKLSDLFQYWGNDLTLSNTQDLLLVSDTVMGQQRVLRRLLTNPGDYLFQPDYGAGLPQYIGQTADIAKITALIRSQILLEAVVSTDPAPVITVTNAANSTDASAIAVTIAYMDAPTGLPQTLSFSLSKTLH
ncbi:MAG: phage tail protein [Gammaproteobacteria bacterium]|nr:phage tail protein [Gammaproteobacteria bacterium]